MDLICCGPPQCFLWQVVCGATHGIHGRAEVGAADAPVDLNSVSFTADAACPAPVSKAQLRGIYVPPKCLEVTTPDQNGNTGILCPENLKLQGTCERGHGGSPHSMLRD